MERVTLLSPEEREKTSHITSMVNNLLSKKTMFEQRRQDENNKTTLGGVSFFYRFDEKDGVVKNVTLCWDIHPKDWNDSDIIQDIQDQEVYMEKSHEMGEAVGFTSFNPFRSY